MFDDVVDEDDDDDDDYGVEKSSWPEQRPIAVGLCNC